MKLGRIYLLILCCALLTGMAAASPTYCTTTTYDSVGIFGNHTAEIENAANTLKSQGADFHLISIPRLTPSQNFGSIATAIAHTCPSWLNGSGSDVNENFIGFIFSTDGKHDAQGKTGRVGILLGGAWKKKIQSQADKIRDSYIMPSFRSLDFAGAAINGINQTGLEIKAFNEASLHPAAKVTTINNQATNLSGLWTFLLWLLALGTLGGAIWMLINVLRKRKEEDSEITTAQQQALATRSDVLSLMSTLESRFSDLDNSGTFYPMAAKNCYSDGARKYGQLGQSEQYNPNTPGLTSVQYGVINEQYNKVLSLLTQADHLLNTPKAAAVAATVSSPVTPEPVMATATLADEPPVPSVPNVPDMSPLNSIPRYHGNHHRHDTVVVHETEVVHDSPVYVSTPVFVPAPPVFSYEPTFRPSEPIYSEPEPERSSFTEEREEEPTRSSFTESTYTPPETSSFTESSYEPSSDSSSSFSDNSQDS